jgi:hypothetical protein
MFYQKPCTLNSEKSCKVLDIKSISVFQQALNIVHYSGKEDAQYCGFEMLDQEELKKWTNKVAKSIGLNSTFIIPKVGDEFEWK